MLTHTRSSRGKHVHHGRTLAAWTGSTIALVAFILGGDRRGSSRTGRCSGPSVALAARRLIATVVLQRMGSRRTLIGCDRGCT